MDRIVRYFDFRANADKFADDMRGPKYAYKYVIVRATVRGYQVIADDKPINVGE